MGQLRMGQFPSPSKSLWGWQSPGAPILAPPPHPAPSGPKPHGWKGCAHHRATGWPRDLQTSSQATRVALEHLRGWRPRAVLIRNPPAWPSSRLPPGLCRCLLPLPLPQPDWPSPHLDGLHHLQLAEAKRGPHSGVHTGGAAGGADGGQKPQLLGLLLPAREETDRQTASGGRQPGGGPSTAPSTF